jgi:hypothetical protein
MCAAAAAYLWALIASHSFKSAEWSAAHDHVRQLGSIAESKFEAKVTDVRWAHSIANHTQRQILRMSLPLRKHQSTAAHKRPQSLCLLVCRASCGDWDWLSLRIGATLVRQISRGGAAEQFELQPDPAVEPWHSNGKSSVAALHCEPCELLMPLAASVVHYA